MLGSAVGGLGPVLKVKLLAEAALSEKISGPDAIGGPGADAGRWLRNDMNEKGVEVGLCAVNDKDGVGLEAILANGLGDEAIFST